MNTNKIESIKNKVIMKNIIEYTLYDEINIENRVFVSWEMFECAVEDLIKKIRAHEDDKNIKFDSIYPVPRGGLCIGVKLSYITGIPLVTSEEKVTETTLIVDDCTDTGHTLKELKVKFKKNATLVMYHKPTSCIVPDIYHDTLNKQINFCWESKEQRN